MQIFGVRDLEEGESVQLEMVRPSSIEFLNTSPFILRILFQIIESKYEVIPDNVYLQIKNKEKPEYYSQSYSITASLREIELDNKREIHEEILADYVFTLKGLSQESIIQLYNQKFGLDVIPYIEGVQEDFTKQIMEGRVVDFFPFKIVGIKSFPSNIDLAIYLSLVTSYMELVGNMQTNGEVEKLRFRFEQFLLSILQRNLEVVFGDAD